MALQVVASSSSTSRTLVTPAVVDETVTSLQSARQSLAGAVDCLVFCHSSEASSSHTGFLALRTRVTTYALLYRDLHLPLATKLVQDLSNLMDIYDAMNADIFCQHIHVVAEDVKMAADYASKVVKLHVLLLEDLHTLKEDAHTTSSRLELEAKTAKEQAENYGKVARETSKKKELTGKLMAVGAATMAFDAAFFAAMPITSGCYAAAASICSAASAYAFSNAKDNMNKLTVLSTAEMEEAAIAQKAAEIVRGPLIDAIWSFIEAVERVAGFLRKLEGDVSNYANNASRMAANKARIAIHLRVIKSQGAKIQQACAGYLNIIPALEGRMGALSMNIGDSGRNRVQKWLSIKAPDIALENLNALQ